MKIINGVLSEIEKITNNFSDESFNKNVSSSTIEIGGLIIEFTVCHEIFIKNEEIWITNTVIVNNIKYTILKNITTNLVEVYLDYDKIYTKQL